ncbi:MAG: hypothetical protein V3V01_19415 [Acidimicrobiales bacterium]
MRSIRNSTLIFTAVLALFASLLPVAESASAQSNSFPNGQWAGSLSFSGPLMLGGVEVFYSSHGSFDLDVSDDGVDGIWNLRVSSVVPVAGSNSAAISSAIGPIEGDAITPVLELDSVTVQPVVGPTLTFTADELPTPGAGWLRVTAFDCNAITGEWQLTFSGQPFDGTFIAQPLNGAGAPRTSQADFHHEGVQILSDLAEGTVNIEQILSYISRAETIAHGTTVRSAGCDAVTARRFSTAATSLIDSVLVQAGVDFEALDDETFLALYRAGFRTGAFDFNGPLAAAWETQFVFRAFLSVNSEERSDWEFWLPIAREFGEEELEQALTENIEGDNRRRGD